MKKPHSLWAVILLLLGFCARCCSLANEPGALLGVQQQEQLLEITLSPTLLIHGVVGTQVKVEYTEALGPVAVWQSLGTIILTNNPHRHVDVTAPPGAKRFYRGVPAGGGLAPAQLTHKSIVFTASGMTGVEELTFQSSNVFASDIGGAGTYTYQPNQSSATLLTVFTNLSNQGEFYDFDLAFTSGSGGTWSGNIHYDGIDHHLTGTFTISDNGPEIVAQPENLTRNVGESVTLSVTAIGSGPLTYQWFKGGAAIPGAVSATHHIASVLQADAGVYTVTVSNLFGAVTSQGALLTVLAPLAAPETLEGTGLQFSFSTAEGPFQELFTFQDATFLSDLDTQVTGIYNYIATGASAQLLLDYTSPALYANDLYQVQLTFTGANQGTVTGSLFYEGREHPATGSFTLIQPQAPQITQHPQSATRTVGGSVTFSVTATGPGAFSYQWLKNGETLVGATGHQFTIASVTLQDAGSYSVRVTSAHGSTTSNPAVLTVQGNSNAPASLSGRAIQFLLTGGAAGELLQFSSSINFTSDIGGGGVYTYSANGNNAALHADFTHPAAFANDFYSLQLTFTTATAGTWTGNLHYEGADHLESGTFSLP